jgi:CDP-diacylglycerol--glycerol-3-phosphate 3-phosphatidyltransferase
MRGAPWGSRLLTASTGLRIVLVPPIMVLISAAGVSADGGEALAAAVLFVIAALTDFVDGKLARRWKLSSPLGSFLDTTADKLLVACVLIALLDVGHVAAWVAAVIISRELLILGLRSAVAVEGTVVEASMWGKLKTSVQFLAILLAILHDGDRVGGLYVDEWAMLVAAVVTVGSAVDYIARFASRLRTAA